MDIAQYRSEKAARLARGEAKPVAPASIAPPVLPPEAFVNVAEEALVVPVSPAPVQNIAPPTSWARIDTKSDA